MSAPAATSKKPTAGKNKKKKKAKAVPASTSGAEAKAGKRRKVGAAPVFLVGDTNPHLINDNAPKIVAFPHEAQAVDKAFAENRRDQLADAEKAARDLKSPDRWRTVLFSLRGLPDRTDPEACFWRVLSFYRLGETERARAVRSDCELPAKDSATLNGEDALVSGIPAIGTVPREDQFGPPGKAGAGGGKDVPKAAPSIAANAAASAYAGPGPQRYQ